MTNRGMLFEIMMSIYWWVIAMSCVRLCVRTWCRDQQYREAILYSFWTATILMIAIFYTAHRPQPWLIAVALVIVVPIVTYTWYVARREERIALKSLNKLTPMPGLPCLRCPANDTLSITFRPHGRIKEFENYKPYIVCTACGAEWLVETEG